jgi:hypothetical protein
VARLTLEKAYPGISFRRRTRTLWARLTRVFPECVHLERGGPWMATFIPDTLYLCGRASDRREPSRPAVSLCRECITNELIRDLSQYHGRVLAFEPDGETFSQYFFVGAEDFTDAGLQSEVAAAITRRIQQPGGECQTCQKPATWFWIPRSSVSSLDEAGRIAMASGEEYCARHGAEKLCAAFAELPDVNLFYVNTPYGDAGAYVWF